MTALSPAEAALQLASLPAWQIESGVLVRTFVFADFKVAIRFVDQVAELAEDAGHHPDIDIRYNRVRLALVTHDAGGLTAKDFALAAAAGKLA
jgi:4a-hydroxytetrahydrobiopterin dehydratase